MTNDDTPIGIGDSAKFLGVSVPTFRKIRASSNDLIPTKVGDREKFRPSVLRGHLERSTRRSGR
jgi:hypothetical protein